jgi:hypothetical protein
MTTRGFGQTQSTNGNGVGNGGDVVVCDAKVELLDFVEAKLLKKFSFSRVADLDHQVIARKAITNLRRVDPELGTQYEKVLLGIELRLQFLDKADFRDVPDSFEVGLPTGCQLKQVAIQQEAEGIKQIRISRALWEKLDPFNKAGLLTHEIIYEHFLLLGETNSVKARTFNAYIFSNEIARHDVKTYRAFRRQLGVKSY